MDMPKRLSIALLSSVIGATLLIGTVYAVTRTQPMSFDQQFIDMMVPHHQGAVEMAHIAQERAEHQEIRALGAVIVRSQATENERMQAWREAWFGSAETPPMSEMPTLVEAGHEGHDEMQGDVATMNMAADVD